MRAMKILGDKQLENILKKNIKKYDSISFCIAFATHRHNVFEELWKNKSKLKQCTFGLDNHITSPDFIRKFSPTKKAKFISSRGKIFHPKIYFFENSKSDWVCISGSSNFTLGGIKKNNEFNIIFNSSDDIDNSLYKQIKTEIKNYWQCGKSMSEAEINVYSNARKNKSAPIKPKSSRSKEAWEIEIIKWDWDTFYKKVKKEGTRRTDERIKLLSKVRKDMKNTNFQELSELDRKLIAGYNGPNGIEWGLFGSMKSAFHFTEAINRNNPILAKAIDDFPSRGKITIRDVLEFRTQYKKALIDKKQGMAPLTRLLTMKRPDIFVCITSANANKIKENFGFSHKSSLDNLERYWEELIMKIQCANWYNSNKPKVYQEKQVWRGRVAFLDSIFYES